MTISTLRHCFAIIVVGVFMFPIAWWGLTSIKPVSAIFDRDRVIFFDFEPTLASYHVILGSGWDNLFQGRTALISSMIVATGSTILTISIALGAAFCLSRLMPRLMPHRARNYLNFILLQRIIPPIAIIIPLVFMFRDMGLHDTHLGLIIAHSMINLPLALFLLKSFMDDIPIDVDHAAMIDGASPFQCCWKILMPMMRGGIAGAAVLCFVFSWTEFTLAVFLTNTIQTLPIKISTFSSWTYGYSSALGSAAILPSFIFILIFQTHLVRGLTLGAIKD
ncbi:MAG: ABC transporter permease subunit [Bacteroidetes bacterium]|jgi:multiple sugar transport system permease protein|nr:ABC transporter permease subunit [Bacteroidota bacterium]